VLYPSSVAEIPAKRTMNMRRNLLAMALAICSCLSHAEMCRLQWNVVSIDESGLRSRPQTGLMALSGSATSSKPDALARKLDQPLDWQDFYPGASTRQTNPGHEEGLSEDALLEAQAHPPEVASIAALAIGAVALYRRRSKRRS
jgi:hypothetical protein